MIDRISGSEDTHLSSESEKKLSDRCLPEWQKRLAEIFPKDQSNEPFRAYWPNIIINDQCVKCKMCSQFCPSDALETVTENGKCTHYFISGFCVDCRICQLFCPREAIRREREKISNPFETVSISTASIIECRRCETITLNNPSHLCYWCEEETTIHNQLKETSNKLLLLRD